MIGHPREDMLLAFQDHRLDDRRRRRLAGHLSGCQRCRNVVQAHRTVRGVFALEAPFAPDGVLERALASRAAGMLVMLPVAEPGVRKRVELPSRGFMIAVGMLLVVGAGAQLFPVDRIQQVWGAVGAVLVGWQPSGRSLLQYPRAPVAPAARILPSRLRAHVATYRSTQHQGEAPAIVVSLRHELQSSTDGWIIREARDGRYGLEVVTDRSLNALRWEFTNMGSERFPALRMRLALLGDSTFTVSARYTPKPGKVLPPTRADYDSTYPVTSPPTRPYTISPAHFFAFLQGLPLRAGWVGSVANTYMITSTQSLPSYRISYVAEDGGMVTTPAGSFDTWQLTPLHLGFMNPERYWIRKSDGLVVKHLAREGDWGYEVVLEAVTFP